MVSTVTDQYGQTKQTFTGYIPDLINILQTRMGFIPTIQLAPTNLSYDAIVKTVPAGIYDIIVGDVSVTSERSEIVDFSNSIYDNALVIVMRKDSNNNFELLTFLKPFSRNLWLLILSTPIVGGILFCLLEREDNEVFQDKSIIYSLEMSVWYCFGHLFGYGVDFYARTAAGRLLTAGFYIVSLVFVASYTANLASILTISKSTSIISGLDDIISGKIPYNRIGIRVGTASEAFYLREISSGRRNYYPLKNKQETYDCILNRTIDLSFLDIGVAQYITNNIYCNLTIVGEAFNQGIMAIVTPKQWLYEQDLDANILALREIGELDQLKSKWFDTMGCPASSEISSAIEIESISGLFLIFGIIYSLSILLFIWKKRQIPKDHLAKLVS
jgi:ABC-type amino acid transport substrate-binding protein